MKQVLALARNALGDEALRAAYLYGSAVTTGGLRAHSDIDVLLLTSRTLGATARRRLATGAMGLSGPIGQEPSRRPLELTVVSLDAITPWCYPPQRAFQYGEWLREDFALGRIPPAQTDPDLTILLHSVLTRSVALAGPPATELLDPTVSADLPRAIGDVLPELLESLCGDERNVLLTLARMWLTLMTGTIVPKDAAARLVIGRLPDELRPILAMAEADYLGLREVAWADYRGAANLLARHLADRIRGLLAAAGSRVIPLPCSRPLPR